MTRYSSLDTTFTNTREAKFLNFLIEAMEAGDQAAFTSAVVEFNQVMALDNWKTAILLKVKRGIAEDPTIL
jgi:alpha-soluble NSF attachment protein